ncbi:MAG: hypothetical protein ACTHM0_13305 [Sphingomonas sp.]
MILNDYLGDGTRHVFDALSITVLLGAISDMLPSIAALLTIIWTGLRIYESKTVQELLGRRSRGAEAGTDPAD